MLMEFKYHKFQKKERNLNFNSAERRMQWSHMNRRRRGTGNGIMRTEAGRFAHLAGAGGGRGAGGVCMEILGNARNELYLSMRFLDVALSSLYFAPDPSVRGWGPTAPPCFQMESLAAMYKRTGSR